MELWEALSPLDHRYAQADPELFRMLSRVLSEGAMVRTELRVELAVLSEHLSLRGEAQLTNEERHLIHQAATAQAVYAEEARTDHHVRALVNVIQAAVPDRCRPLVHLGATSADISDTASILRLRGIVTEVLLPLGIQVSELLIGLVRAHADTPQVGRTHGQIAVPITFGFALASHASRLTSALSSLATRAGELRAAISGATGSANALSLIVGDPRAFEAAVLARLGLTAAEHSTQITPVEPAIRVYQEAALVFGVLADLHDDLRHLQRSEIAELAEGMTADQVGSSTMPHKRNPWRSEHVKSLWKAFIPRLTALYSDQLSEHQRDLTNSASGRFHPEILAGLALALKQSARVLDGLGVDRNRMLLRIRENAASVLAEAFYILAADAGSPDAHERMRRLTRDLDAHGPADLKLALDTEPDLRDLISSRVRERLNTDLETLIAEPERYSGIAAERARSLADLCAARVEGIRRAANEPGLGSPEEHS